MTYYVSSGTLNPTQSLTHFCYVLKFWLDWIYSFGDSAIFRFSCFGLNLPICAHFYVFWDIFSQNNVTYRPAPKRHLLAPRLSHKAWKSVRRYDLWAWLRKKDRTVKKSQRCYISPSWGEAPPTDLRQNLLGVCHPWRNLMCKVWDWNFQRLRFYEGLNFGFSYWFLHGPYNLGLW